MATIHDTARALLAFMRAGASFDAAGFTSQSIVKPTPEVKALCVRLATVAPTSITAREGAVVPNYMTIRVGTCMAVVHNPAPSCFRHADGVEATWDSENAAGAELLRLAAIDAPADLASARDRHQPHPSIPVDGEPAKRARAFL